MEQAYFSFYVGWVAIIAGAVWLSWRIYKNYKIEKQKTDEIKLQEKRKMEFYNKPLLEKLELLQINDILVYWNNNYQVIGKSKLIEMTWDEYDNHIATGRFFPIICLDQNRYLVSMPKGEGIDIVWFFMEKEALSSSLTPFFEGTDENPGPAMIFADSEQTAYVTFALPGKTEKWQMTDIGSFFFEGQGVTFMRGKGEARHVLAQSTENPKRYMLFFDVIEGNGTDTLLVGENINPEMEIEYVLR
ncbi:hypothetical protein [Raineya sp.]|jgi:hypothetical protein